MADAKDPIKSGKKLLLLGDYEDSFVVLFYFIGGKAGRKSDRFWLFFDLALIISKCQMNLGRSVLEVAGWNWAVGELTV